jgi:hypothetical protein
VRARRLRRVRVSSAPDAHPALECAARRAGVQS